MSQTLDNEIVHRSQGGQSMRGIARDLGISRWRVERTLALNQTLRNAESLAPVNAQLPKAKQNRPSKLDQYLPAIEQLLERYPNITGVRMFEELKTRGYAGGFTTVREKVKTLRRRPKSPLTVRFETAAGVQAQMDWSTYEIDFAQEGRRRVNLFSYILGYSRRQYIVFSERQDFEATVRGHVQALGHVQRVAATCLYGNMDVGATRWADAQPLYNVRFLAFATHYGYRPWACRPFRPQTKGKVERPFQYVESSCDRRSKDCRFQRYGHCQFGCLRIWCSVGTCGCTALRRCFLRSWHLGQIVARFGGQCARSAIVGAVGEHRVLSLQTRGFLVTGYAFLG